MSKGEAYSLPYGKPLRVYGMAKAYRPEILWENRQDCYANALPLHTTDRSDLIFPLSGSSLGMPHGGKASFQR